MSLSSECAPYECASRRLAQLVGGRRQTCEGLQHRPSPLSTNRNLAVEDALDSFGRLTDHARLAGRLANGFFASGSGLALLPDELSEHTARRLRQPLLQQAHDCLSGLPCLVLAQACPLCHRPSDVVH